MKPLIGLTCIAAIACLADLASASATASIDASLDRPSMRLDEAARLTIEVRADRQAEVELPHVDGLTFVPTGSSSNVQVANGRMSFLLNQSYRVKAEREGTYEIPLIRVRAGKREIFSKEKLHLEVTKGRSAPPASPPQALQGGGRRSIQSDPGVPSTVNGIAALEVRLSKDQAVVGELIPVEVTAYFREGVSIQLNSLPKIEGGAFTLKNQEGKAQRDRVLRGGVPYNRLTFYAGLTPIKEGDLTAEVTLDAVVRTRERGGRLSLGQSGRSPFDSFFDNDAFFDNFIGRVIEKPLPLEAATVDLKVGPVPQSGRPADYAGAVGDFSVQAYTDRQELATGDPVELTFAVEGKGNFGRVKPPRIEAGDSWKVYPAKSEFVSADAIGHQGVKLFRQTLVPRRSEVQEIPPLSFSFYNPDSGQFETLMTESIPLEVTGDALVEERQASESPPAAEPDTGVEGFEHAADEAAASRMAKGVRTPLYGQTWFQVSQIVALLGVILGFAGLADRRIRQGSGHARRNWRRRIDRIACELDEHVKRADRQAFFETLRGGVQEAVARVTGIEAGAVTAADVDDDEIRELLEAADAVLLAGVSIPASEFPSWRNRCLAALRRAGERSDRVAASQASTQTSQTP